MASKEKKEKDYKNILFGYLSTPAFGFRNSYGGFSVAVYEDYRLIHKTYIFDCIDKTETAYKISESSVTTIKMIINKYQKDIDAFDTYLDNGSFDGVGNFFIFNGKRIITWNIKYIEENELKKINPDYYEEYLPVIKQENKILLLFFKIVEILEREGIKLNLHEVNFDERND